MKTILLSLFLVSLLAPPPARGAFYQWTDAEGVVHFTDNRTNIPKQYRDKAHRVDVSDSAPAVVSPGTESVSRPAPPPMTAPGGHDESWWRERFRALRIELKTLQDERAGKEQQLVELRRKHTIFHRSRDREAVNTMEAQVSAVDAKISDMLNRIAALELAAAQAGVPVEWRQ
ncbi:DUF4124 domain-containing protein [Geomonas sp. Red69]|uniref:DUF4124 domain-containing protein n=1 Tax=Geomonas diazotrophica TaxID=2843197 RepID=A0ABX8JVS9_9BACT|nr:MULTISPECIES: DUF4124 domain-containing protein [Geomonas]MBU5637231.1 DUF4124 domain-containing protein [Geomonas diazotrophica]QWV99525.1 DUF4124 domain-containing protein [Geomonas nitrogeniifigens]QXE88700.1 DUF4124 domain-containing protein [Geomonas nitrogeniifigens]